MSVHPLHPDTNTIEDLTVHEVGDLSLWIGQQKQYCNVPGYVSNELCQRTALLPSVSELLPPTSLPVLQLLEFPTPRITSAIPGIIPGGSFSFYEATHTSLECCQIPAPTSDLLRKLRASAGQAMLDGKVSIQHWDRKDIFLPFDALGTWAFILEIDIAKKAWINALHWMEDQRHAIPEEYIERIKSLLGQVPWKDYIKGLGSDLTTTEMATLLSKKWLSDAHIYTMLAVTRHLCHNMLSCADPCIEIASCDFASHVLTSPLLSTTPITSDYFRNAPKSVIRLGNKVKCAASGMIIAAVAYSPENHWACLLINSQARTIQWGDSMGRAMPTGGEDRLRAWLSLFLPHTQFQPLQNLSCASQSDSYSCGVIAVNTLKHHLFGDDLWTLPCRETLRVEEFLDIMEFSESQKANVSVSALCTLLNACTEKLMLTATHTNSTRHHKYLSLPPYTTRCTCPLRCTTNHKTCLPSCLPITDHM